MAHLVITIGCEYGAKGNMIGKKVAEDLGIKFYDRDTVDEIIKEVGIPKDIMNRVEEGGTIAGKGAEGDVRGSFSKYADLTERAIHVQKQIIRKLAEKEACVIIGRSADGTKAVTAYFIMGRSENSRNRVFVEDGEGIRTQAFDPSKLTDPSLIIYAPVRVLGNKTIVTNGDQTDTIYEGMDKQLTFEQSLRSREFEPDGPNYTPRISGVMHIENGEYSYAMSILKSDNGNPDACLRYTYAYEKAIPGEGRFIHTYKCDGNPLPSFEGEPKLVDIPDDMEAFTELLWNSLNEDNKVSLFVRYIDIATGNYETKIVNKNK